MSNPNLLSETDKITFIETLKRTESVHLVAIAKLLNFSWRDVKHTIQYDIEFRERLQEWLESLKYEIFQGCIERATGKKVVKGSFDLSTAKAALALIESGALIPFEDENKDKKEPSRPASNALSLLERIGISSLPSEPDSE